tara:strand:+ start:568 stop:1689 length:1122 start_codon:yes stop_codon:yes gene_type:complete
MTFICSRCGKEFKFKSYLERHLKRKNLCKRMLPPNTSKYLQIPPNTSKCLLNLHSEKNTDSGGQKIQCEHCKVFILKKNLKRHQRTVCLKIPKSIKNEIKKKYENYKNKINSTIIECYKKNDRNFKNIGSNIENGINNENFFNDNIRLNNDNIRLNNDNSSENNNINYNNSNSNIKLESSNDYKSINNKVNNLINNKVEISNSNNKTNTINIFNINALGKENISGISKDEILNILDRSYNSIPLTLKKIHFDIKENRNLYQPNSNKPYVKYFDGNRWLYQKIEMISDQLGLSLTSIIEDWYSKYKKEIKDSSQQYIKQMIDEFDDGKLDNKINNEFKMFLMNYSEEIKLCLREKINKDIDIGLQTLIDNDNCI